ncbi:MAG: hypothetical protein QMD77_02250 [Patescibacteria group bacterium]|nr:hypothetical protein [Patescibacteria group bacterium]
MENKVSQFVFWTPRILSMIFIAFLALMSLDVFGTGAGFWETLAGFLIHNIPVFILIAVLAISWKREIVGGIIFILAGLLYIFFGMKNAGDWRMALAWSVQISGVAFLIGGFFLANWFKKRK